MAAAANRRIWRLDEIVAALGGTLVGDPASCIRQVAPIATARPDEISFLSNRKFVAVLAQTQAGAVILTERDAGAFSGNAILTPNPYVYYARVVALLNPAARPSPGLAPGAVSGSPVPASVCVGANAVIGERVRLGERVIIGPGCVVGDDVELGDDTELKANVTIYGDCRLGARCVVQSGAVIGGDGFGFANEAGRWVKIPQIGRVVIGDDVEIGANTTVDRGALDDTVIANGVKLDNLIQIAHNVQIGEDSAMAGCTGVAGSTRFGKRCTVGGAGMISGHLEIGDDVHVSGGTLVAKSLKTPGHYTATFPLDTHDKWLHNAVYIRQLDSMAKRIKALERALEKLGANDTGTNTTGEDQ